MWCGSREDKWLAGLGGRFGDYPPTDVDEWRQFGRTLAHPIWDEVLKATELVTKPAAFRFPRSVRRHFERLDRFPDGLVPVGDSVCHFNPLYGQGMSAAACQARALGDVLERRSRGSQDLTGLALEFFPEAFEVTRTPWALAAAADFRDRRTTGDFPVEELQSLAMFQLAVTLADTDPEAARLVADIGTLVRPLSALHTPPWPERLAQTALNCSAVLRPRRPVGGVLHTTLLVTRHIDAPVDGREPGGHEHEGSVPADAHVVGGLRRRLVAVAALGR